MAADPSLSSTVARLLHIRGSAPRISASPSRCRSSRSALRPAPPTASLHSAAATINPRFRRERCGLRTSCSDCRHGHRLGGDRSKPAARHSITPTPLRQRCSRDRFSSISALSSARRQRSSIGTGLYHRRRRPARSRIHSVVTDYEFADGARTLLDLSPQDVDTDQGGGNRLPAAAAQRSRSISPPRMAIVYRPIQDHAKSAPLF